MGVTEIFTGSPQVRALPFEIVTEKGRDSDELPAGKYQYPQHKVALIWRTVSATTTNYKA